MFHKVTEVTALPDFQLSVVFSSGEKKLYDAKPIMQIHEAFKAFTLTQGLFQQVQVSAGGYGVYWNNEIDLSCNELYSGGKQQ